MTTPQDGEPAQPRARIKALDFRAEPARAVRLRCLVCGNETTVVPESVESTQGGAFICPDVACDGDGAHAPAEMARESQGAGLGRRDVLGAPRSQR